MIEGQPAPCDQGVLQAERPDARPCEADTGVWILAATILGSSLAFITGSVVNVALPGIQSGLDASAAEMQWVINAYLLTLGAFILIGGSAGDRYGRRRLFAAGIILFSAASAACGWAPDVRWLIALRAVQGVGGALLVPNSLAIISAAFQGEARGKAIGTWSGFSALTTAFGPALGGWLVDAFSWRWVFFVVIPPALVTLGITWWRLPRSAADAQGRLDVRGALLAAGGMGALTLGLIASQERGWSDGLVIAALAGGFALAALFVAAERRHPDPMLPLELFRSRTFTGANAMTLLLYAALNGALFFLPFTLIQVWGYSATAAGATFLPFTLLVAGLSRWSGGLVERWGPRRPLVLGPLIAAAGLGVLLAPGTSGSYWVSFFPALLVLGLGMALSVAPLTTVVMDSVEDARAGTASGINNAAARVAGLLAISLLGTVAVGVFGDQLEAELATVEAPEPARQAVYEARGELAAAAVPEGVSDEAQVALRSAIDEAYMHAFRWAMGLAAACALLSAVAAAWLIRPDQTADE